MTQGGQSQKQKRVSKSRPMARGFSSAQRVESAGMLLANLQGATRRGRISQGALSPRNHRVTVCASRRLRFVRVLLRSDRDDVNDLLNYGVTRRKKHWRRGQPNDFSAIMCVDRHLMMIAWCDNT